MAALLSESAPALTRDDPAASWLQELMLLPSSLPSSLAPTPAGPQGSTRERKRAKGGGLATPRRWGRRAKAVFC